MPSKYCREKCTEGTHKCRKRVIKISREANVEVEKHDLNDVIEVEQIRKLLKNHPDLLSMFKLMIIVANKRINQESMAFYLEEDPEEDEEEDEALLLLREEDDDDALGTDEEDE